MLRTVSSFANNVSCCASTRRCPAVSQITPRNQIENARSRYKNMQRLRFIAFDFAVAFRYQAESGPPFSPAPSSSSQRNARSDPRPETRDPRP
eukprot:3941408-Rhodomonas_salina.2